VDEVNYLDSGGLEVQAVHEGNRTTEVFPEGHWTHCTVKQLAPEVVKYDAERMKGLVGNMPDDAIDALKAHIDNCYTGRAGG
jgi:hypothetical protein